MPHRTRQNRGFTRLEAVLAAGFAAGLFGLGYFWFGSRAEDQAAKEAKASASRVLSAASSWKRTHAVRGCPSLSQLVLDQHLTREEATDDPWGGRFRISCSEDRIEVQSAGGDRRFRTPDDISLAADWKS